MKSLTQISLALGIGMIKYRQTGREITQDQVKEAQQKLVSKLQQVEDVLSKNWKGNEYLLNHENFTYADARISPFILNVFKALQGGHENLKDIEVEKFPKTQRYVENLRNHEKYGSAYSFDS